MVVSAGNCSRAAPRSLAFLSFWLSTSDLHFLSFLSGAENEIGAIEQAIYDIGLLLDAIVRHLSLAVAANHNQGWSFAVLNLRGHLDKGLRPIVKHSHRANVLVAAAHFVVKVHLFNRDHGRQNFLRPSLLLGQRALLGKLLLPCRIVVIFRISECKTPHVVLRL